MPIVFGHLGDRFGKKKIMALAFTFCICGCLLTAFSRNAAGLFAGMFFLGSGAGIMDCIGTAALSDSHPEKSEKNLTASQSFYSGGAVVSPFVVAALMNAGASRQIVFITSVVIFLCLAPLLKMTQFTVREPDGGHKSGRQSVFSLLKSTILIALAACLLVYVGIEAGVAYFADSFFTAEFDRQSLSAAAISLYWLAITLSRVFLGVVNVNPKKLITVFWGLSAITLVLLSISASAPIALALCALTGFLFGPIWPVLMALAAKKFSASTGTAASIMMVGGGAGGALFPFLMGLAADHANLRWSVGLLAVFCFAAFLCCAAAFRKKRGTI
jgi:FHS family glucose/mannose:H+ symporter-like MFS transporter